MKTRYDKLVVVRAAASKVASAAFADVSAQLAAQKALADRLANAAAALSPEPGVLSAAGLAARNELLGRMYTAVCVTNGHTDDLLTDRDDRSIARRVARRSLDAVVDIRRRHQRTALRCIEAKTVPAKPPEVER